MSEYVISQVRPADRRAWSQIDALLEREGIRRDGNLDYTCAMYDDNYDVIGTGSCFGNTLRCFAVSGSHQGEGLLNQIISHLMQVQYERGNLHLFLYTKTGSALFFQDLGFYEIARVDGTLVFMENRRDGFLRYIEGLKNSLAEKAGSAGDRAESFEDGTSLKNSPAGIVGFASGQTGYVEGCGSLKNSRAGEGRPLPGASNPSLEYSAAAIIMNANPFTLGHQYLVETAAAQCGALHLFVVSEDASLVPASVRRRLVEEGVAHLPNVMVHDCGPYMISSATFPSYFLKDEAAVISGHAKLDICIFTKIAKALGIRARFVGEEPTSEVTGIYNQIMAEELPKEGIDCRIIPRKEISGTAISASTVRQCLQRSDWDALSALVPESTLRYFMGPEAAPVLDVIRRAGNVVHY